MILETANLTKNFGGLVAISNVDLSIEAGEVRGIIGPNGSGKSTLFNLISGIYKPEQGSRIVFDGVDITNQEPHVIARQGVARTFQLLRLFQQMTVLDNLLVGHHTHVRYGMRTALVGTMKLWDEEKRLRQEMMELLDFIGLADYADMPSAELSGGQRRQDR